ncbi:MAG TPA: hypothetical protein VF544_02915 [Pyrinomonadaceae bacterium]
MKFLTILHAVTPSSVFFSVQVDGLEELPAGANYDLVGNQPPFDVHPSNHYGTHGLNQSLIGLADAYAAQYPGSRLGFNDMSLPQGWEGAVWQNGSTVDFQATDVGDIAPLAPDAEDDGQPLPSPYQIKRG